ncbi:LLM class flavin-dependent oxidoreductase [Minwuia thermotolerans]|uniref:LLM class F420-dependent oxidoreductase n=1 Tax=Minwuia thermotolerans TaxID=2056226 RepID=A0A2M9FXL5_9PROT|nr:LLM class flavin-dependent oxidoreductase [Minwuia thermotolerans]PJK28197.1 LLM class F420-dependent oxidoreductase [Minwuia thermotolerans]
MAKIGYLLPTRERVMEGRHETAPLLALAERAEGLGFDSLWAGDSLLARPRHEPLTLLAAVAARTAKAELGTAVLLPALRNPVILAHMAATVDRISEGRLILGVGIATDVPNVRAEFAAAGVPFEKRVGRMMEGLRLCRALWSGEDTKWEGRWDVAGGALGPTPHREGGPPIWGAASAPAGLKRTARGFDGWFPIGPTPDVLAERWADVRGLAREAGRNPDDITFAVYLTLAIDEDPAAADRRIDAYLENYYGQPGPVMRRLQACFGGDAAGAADWLRSYADAGASHIVLRLVGDHECQMDQVAAIRQRLGW